MDLTRIIAIKLNQGVSISFMPTVLAYSVSLADVGVSKEDQSYGTNWKEDHRYTLDKEDQKEKKKKVDIQEVF